MRFVIVDLEATCWDQEVDRSKMEIIEIGALILHDFEENTFDEFSRFIKPIVEPQLSEFCKRLTTITQEQVNNAEKFPTVFSEFLSWVGNDPFTLCSWGGYDLNQFKKDCASHKINFPQTFERHINLKKEFSRVMNVPPCGMSKALRIVKLQLEGTHHRGIDDARNIAKLAKIILPKIKSD